MPARLVAFAAALTVLFGMGFAAGDAFGPQRDVPDHDSAPAHQGDIHDMDTRDTGR